jgi:hypothetical protein
LAKEKEMLLESQTKFEALKGKYEDQQERAETDAEK